MLNIRRVKHLLRCLEVAPEQLEHAAKNVSSYYEELVVVDPKCPSKKREVVSVTGLLRQIQNNLYRNVLLKRIPVSQHSHGGIVGRSVKTNVEPHVRSQYVLKMDIAKFYPSVHYSSVYRLFNTTWGCSPDVSRICTLVTTYKYHLALGLITSPFIGNAILTPLDHRISSACSSSGLVYTRYVDDITISGPFQLADNRSGFSSLVSSVLRDQGLNANLEKYKAGALRSIPITGVKIDNGRLDVPSAYFREFNRQLNDARRLAAGKALEGPYFTCDQIRGRMHYIIWINPRRKNRLRIAFNQIDWSLHTLNAEKFGYVALKRQILRP